MCYMVSPSDMAPALMALDAKAEIAGPKGSRFVPLTQFYIMPEKNILKETILSSQEMLVGVEIPAPAQGAKGVFLKVKERQAFDFALANVAINLMVRGSTVADCRIVFGGVAPMPLRSVKAEAALKGKEIKQGMAAACAAAVEGARPLNGNSYKIQMTKGVLEKALSELV